MLDPRDLLELGFLRDASVSPDGCHVCYCVSRTAAREWFELWIVEIETGSKARIPFDGDACAPRWSPDGHRIAFAADGRLRTASFPALTVSEPLTPAGLHAKEPCSWSPDSSRVVLALSERVDEGIGTHIVERRYRADGIGHIGGYSHRIYQVDLDGRAPRCLSPSDSHCRNPEWSPNGREILFLAGDPQAPYSLYGRSLKCVNLDDASVRSVLSPDWHIESANWLPDGERMAIVAAFASDATVPTTRLWVIDRLGRSASLRTPDLQGNIGARLQHDMPCRELTGRSKAVPAGAGAVLVEVQAGGCVEVWSVTVDGDTVTAPLLAGERSCIVIGASAELDLLVYATADLFAPPEIWISSLTGQAERRLTGINTQVLSRWPRFQARRFSFASQDGVEVEGWFLCKAGASGPLPTVLSIHAGPFLAAGHMFRFDFLLLAASGFGVVFANFRGSSGYGEHFSNMIMGDWGRHGFQDHMGTADTVVSLGWADPERLGVWGTSHGGFATCWIVTHCDRFKAAFAEAAITDFRMLYYLTDIPEVFARDLGGKPHEVPEVYEDRSPMTYAHHCRTPTLLLHAMNDLRCPAAGSEQFYRALQDSGCPVEMILLADGAHTSDSTGPLESRVAQNEALIGWFGRRL